MTEDFKSYVCSYKHKGEEWGLTIPAESFEDAEARLGSIGAFGKVKGELMGTIPAGPARVGGLLARLMVWLGNASSHSSGR